MRILILDENYPHLNNLLGDVFVHVRAKEYAKSHKVKVFSFFHEAKQVVYEGIELQIFNDINSLLGEIKNYNPEKILIHFYQSWMLEKLIKVFQVPVIVWVHGYEALGWYRRLFNYTLYSPVFFNYIKRNTRQQLQFRKLIKYANKTKAVRFVFVSEWMRRITEQDTLSNIQEYNIIANPIDIKLFRYVHKLPVMRTKVLLLRSFESRKYANDIAISAILELSKRTCFKNFEFAIIGKGPLFDKTVNPVKKFDNIEFRKEVIQQVMIPAIHAQYGIFLCPTRQDAQGVSMCEAMSSGLVPVTSNNTAIPEFVEDNVTGILTTSAVQVADALEELYNRPGNFSEMSVNASQSMNRLCNIDAITQQELAIIQL